MIKLFVILILVISLFSNEVSLNMIEIGDLNRASDVSIVDINNDDLLDIITTAYNDGVVVFINEGNFSFRRVPVAAYYEKPFSRSIRGKLHDETKLDFNNDGFADMLSCAMDDNSLTLWLNNQDETFTEVVIDSMIMGSHTVDVQDLNNDNLVDILVSGKTNDLCYYINKGNLNFERYRFNNNGSFMTFVHSEDVDGNGKNDILAVDYAKGDLYYYAQMDSLEFDSVFVDNINGMHTAMLKDFDNDGDFDILGAAYLGCKFVVWKNDGNGNFDIVFDKFAWGGSWLDMVDLDDDGDQDLIGTAEFDDYHFDFTWFENLEDSGDEEEWLFTTRDIEHTINKASCVKAGDLNNDGKPDLVIASNGGQKLLVYENQGLVEISENTIPLNQSLLRCYPNPFNPHTNIHFHIVNRGNVEVIIYNSLGQIVFSNQLGMVDSGDYSIKFDATSLNSGVYFCKLQNNGEGRAVVKLSLLK
ncbi:MAG: T9SS type A sorting domain-containing protein [Candidatus Delongbacteria bacterium]|nr:T9SS type A sorting domain-containing protein [Candidatus Delongbacteria bacterium]MBN2833906.1 T9SS type A sorting domain-containing protein [Candidatus Delongbacteria bacterium]